MKDFEMTPEELQEMIDIAKSPSIPVMKIGNVIQSPRDMITIKFSFYSFRTTNAKEAHHFVTFIEDLGFEVDTVVNTSYNGPQILNIEAI